MRIVQFFIFLGILVAFRSSVLADETQGASSTELEKDESAAKELNRKGLVLLEAEDYAGALSAFERSRAVFRSYANTRNVALCLDALGRKKEALAMFETLLSDYAVKLGADERVVLEKRVTELRNEIGPPSPVSPPPPPPDRTAVSVTTRPDKPRTPGRWSVGGFIGYTTGSSLGSDAEAYVATNCTTKCPATSGVMAGARVEFRITRLLTLEASVGYMQHDSEFAQSWHNDNFTHTLDIKRSLFGGFADLGASLRLPLGDRVGIVGRFAVGGLFANVTNTNAGFVTGEGSQQADLLVSGGKPSIEGNLLYFRPELGLEVSALPFVLGVGIGAIVSTTSGPTFGELRLRTERNACWDPTLGACAPDLDVSTGHRGYGVFVALVPQIGVRFQFD